MQIFPRCRMYACFESDSGVSHKPPPQKPPHKSHPPTFGKDHNPESCRRCAAHDSRPRRPMSEPKPEQVEREQPVGPTSTASSNLEVEAL